MSSLVSVDIPSHVGKSLIRKSEYLLESRPCRHREGEYQHHQGDGWGTLSRRRPTYTEERRTVHEWGKGIKFGGYAVERELEIRLRVLLLTKKRVRERADSTLLQTKSALPGPSQGIDPLRDIAQNSENPGQRHRINMSWKELKISSLHCHG